MHFAQKFLSFTAALKTISNNSHLRVRKAEATGACRYALPFCSQGWLILDQEGQGFDLDSISLKTPQRKRKGTEGEASKKEKKTNQVRGQKEKHVKSTLIFRAACKPLTSSSCVLSL
ncbi:hypothetical protein QQF64_022005 [Cirrhinus molitorella]|uniref:Uncharacterized protein n=1 Tax=Cirrhinus molitorella TaxID=172907 RepID=A0ABR3L732_9TELE